VLRYAVHAYAWTSSWSNDDLWIVDHAAELGLDAIEIPLMEPDKVDPAAIAKRAEACGLEVLTSLALPDGADPASEEERERRRGLELLRRCVDLTADMGATILTGVVYSTIGRRIDRRPDDGDYERAAGCCARRHGTPGSAPSRSGSSRSTATRPTSSTPVRRGFGCWSSPASRTSASISTPTT